MADTRLTPELELDGLSPDEAFAVLGNETRLNIIHMLWKAGALHDYDDIDDTDTTISYSELRDAAKIEDNGQFNYHLSKLIPHFVQQTDDGYRLSGAAKKITRTVVAISGNRNPDVSNELQIDCPVCGGSIMAAYEDLWLRFTCTECDGLFGDAAPDGAILNTMFPAAGVTDRSPNEALTTGVYRCMIDMTYLMQGICRECTNPITSSISICEDHDVDEAATCGECKTPFAVWIDHRCDTCRFAKRLPIELCVMGLSPVIGFLYDHNVDVLSPSLHEIVEMIRTRIRTTVNRKPLRISVTLRGDTDELAVTFDDDMALIEVSQTHG